MLNVDRIKTMVKLHKMEEGEDCDYLKVNQIYRSDYIGMAMIKNFFAITFAYVLLIALGGLYHFEFLATQWFNLDLPQVIRTIVVWYIVLLIVYTILVYIIYSVRYVKMKKYIKTYDEALKELEDLYAADEGTKDVHSSDRRE